MGIHPSADVPPPRQRYPHHPLVSVFHFRPVHCALSTGPLSGVVASQCNGVETVKNDLTTVKSACPGRRTAVL
eukprot:673444-Hanusia_phi.AAC.1